ncbi:MAG: hypothetical protein ACOYMW_04255 [Candidatus Competibacteraceae bacterium]
MPNHRFIIRAMTRQHVDFAIDWAAAEGWNPGLTDADCFHVADPDGFLIGVLDEEPIAALSAVRYGDRRQFLQCWVAPPHRIALGIQRQGQFVGYGVLRACRSGFKIGPLFADRAEWAETLFLALKAQAPAGAPLYLDIPEVNPAAVALAERHGMTVVFETARMYRGQVPELPISRLFGVTSFELG